MVTNLVHIYLFLGVEILVVLFSLFNKYSKQCKGTATTTERDKNGNSNAETNQSLRISHKVLFYLRQSWISFIGGETTIGYQEMQQSILDLTSHAFETSDQCSPQSSTITNVSKRNFHNLAPFLSTLFPQVSPQDIEKTCSARHTVRYLMETGTKFPALYETAVELSMPLYSFIHPFDGHFTRRENATHLPQLPTNTPPSSSINTLANISADEISPPLSFGHNSFLSTDDKKRIYIESPNDSTPVWYVDPAPKAARDAMKTHIMWTRPSAIERKYAETWHRMMAEWGPPPALKLDPKTSASQNNNNSSSSSSNTNRFSHPMNLPRLAPTVEEFRKQRTKNLFRKTRQPRFDKSQGLFDSDDRGIKDGVLMGGMVEKEDVIALDKYMDKSILNNELNHPKAKRSRDSDLYVALYPYLPDFAQSITDMVTSWLPTCDEKFTGPSAISPTHFTPNKGIDVQVAVVPHQSTPPSSPLVSRNRQGSFYLNQQVAQGLVRLIWLIRNDEAQRSILPSTTTTTTTTTTVGDGGASLLMVENEDMIAATMSRILFAQSRQLWWFSVFDSTFIPMHA